MPKALDRVKERLTKIDETGIDRDVTYTVPGLWIDPQADLARSSINPARFYLERIRWIEAQPRQPLVGGPPGGEWSKNAVIYNTLVRAATGYDHDSDGQVGLDPLGHGWMETGTFLKTIATLPLVKEMGFNTIHLLPITAIGDDGHKGTLGSVYAIQNPYRPDPRLNEPILDLEPEAELAAFVEAAHHLGLRVVVEFVFRTASKDADWVKEHPEWFYWIEADIPNREPGEESEEAYGAPIFTESELHQIKAQVEGGDREDLIPPHSVYREMFTPPPEPDDVEMRDGSWIGTLADGTQVRIPGAFADWPPDDPQPPWTDVTYLRLYDHPDFNYIAYNTVRMYDAALAQPENRVEPLWEQILGILPHYQRRFGIDGVMIDMGHALPMPLKQRMVDIARDITPDFAFWDENFSISQRSRDEGYNAVIGNYWWLGYRPEKLINEMLRPCAESGYPLPFFAAPESHNTPRAAARPGGPAYGKLLWALGTLLPALPFCHAGFEIGETLPVNTGLDFAPEELADYPAEELPLFSQASYDWDNEPNLIDWIRRTLDIREAQSDLITDPEPATFELIPSTNANVWAVIRRRSDQALSIVFNLNWEATESFGIVLPTERAQLTDMLDGGTFPLADGYMEATLKPSGCVIAEV
jgi:hypothetical protein